MARILRASSILPGLPNLHDAASRLVFNDYSSLDAGGQIPRDLTLVERTFRLADYQVMAETGVTFLPLLIESPTRRSEP